MPGTKKCSDIYIFMYHETRKTGRVYYLFKYYIYICDSLAPGALCEDVWIMNSYINQHVYTCSKEVILRHCSTVFQHHISLY